MAIIKRKMMQQVSAMTLLLWMSFNLLSPVAMAQEATPTETPAETTPPPDPTPAPEPTLEVVIEPTPTPGEQVIATGDAEASAETETVANTNEETVPGTLSTEGCDVSAESECPTDVSVDNTNEATASAIAESTAQSGENSSEQSPTDSSIVTGEANSTSQSSTTANINTVELSSTISPTPSPTLSPTSTPEPDLTELVCEDEEEETATLSVENHNEVSTETVAASDANSGGNAITGADGAATIVTGEANALTNVVNVLNTNIVGTNFQILEITITDENAEDVDLNALWQQILTVDENGNVTQINWPSSPNVSLRIINSNQADVINDASAVATSGDNTAIGNDSATIATGDAAAAANVTNLVNTNIIGSTFFFGYVNILSSGSFNVILPRSEWFEMLLADQTSGGIAGLLNTNSATVTNNVTAQANTGENVGENGTIATGDAVAVANAYTIANTNLALSDWFFLLLNNMGGGWNGDVLNWTSPGSHDTAQLGSNLLTTGSIGLSDAGEGVESTIINENEATITNNVSAIANTGTNTATGNSYGSDIFTGNAMAVANLFNLVNTNILGSRWWMGMINVLSNWGGRVVFAYPDVTVTLSTNGQAVQPGQEIDYLIGYENLGYDTARAVKVNLDLPAGMSFVSDSGKLAGGCTQTYCSWEVGSLGAKQSGEVALKLRVDDDFNFDKNQSFWSKLVPSAKAADDRKDKEVVVKATIATADPESATDNNSFSVSAVVYERMPDTESHSAGDQRQPAISVMAWNNVNEFVYPGDTITFVVNVKNSSDVEARNSRLIQKLYDPDGNYLGSVLFDLGTLGAGKVGKISFGLTVPAKSKGGKYSTSAYVVAEAINGESVNSDKSTTAFLVKPRGVDLVTVEPPIAEEQPAGQVLGITTERGPWCTDRRGDIWIWVTLFLTSTVLLSNRLENRKALAYEAKLKGNRLV